MKNSKLYRWLIFLSYAAMVGVCVYLNLFSIQAEGKANIIVNAVMFALIGLIFLRCEIGSFIPVEQITEELDRATAKSRRDAMNTHRFLWEQYKEDKEELFRNPILKEQFSDYKYELSRIERMERAYYKCDIESFISEDLIDAVIHRNRMNQVAGVMTGLGILGTFIGLSLGLQSFNTGTTAEITNSIEPLMDGIKVAFHTSIYGMVFSLVFNYVYKRILDDAEASVRRFINAYKKYVLPDTTTDGINRLMELQMETADATRSLATTVAHQLSTGLAQLLEPQFDRFDRTITNFGNYATKNQMDALSQVVNAFLAEMNKSLHNAFTELAYTIDQTCETQRENTRQMQEVLDRTGKSAKNLTFIEEKVASITASVDRFVVQAESLQEDMRRSIDDLRQVGETDQLLLEQEHQYLNDLARYRNSINESVTILNDSLKEQQRLIADLQDTVVRLPDQVNETFDLIDNNLIDVENHFQDTILLIKESTDRVPRVVSDAYSGIEKSFDRASEAVQDLSRTLEDLAKAAANNRARRMN